jgi:alcohol dehydrogenase
MVPSYYEFYNPVKIISGHKALDNLPYELDQLGATRPLIVTGPIISGAGLIKHVKRAFAESGMSIGAIYDQVPNDSSEKVVNQVAQIYRQRDCDALVAVGGGSVIDTAKGVNIVVTENSDDLMRFVGTGILEKPMQPLIAIPTTSGSGSEVTQAAVIADPERNVKMLFTSHRLLPRVAILDPRMMLTLPPDTTAATGIDALAQAVEAYTCLQKNPLSDAYAWTAIKLISRNLVRVVKNSQDEEGRLVLANAACMAGIAFSNSMVGIAHTLGHACGGVCHIEHGVAINVFLPHALEYNMHTVEGYIAELLLPLAGPEIYVQTVRESRAEKSVEFIRDLQDELYELTRLPRTLKEAGVPREKLTEIAKTALGDASIIFNPEELDYDDALRILNEAYE